MRTRGLGAALQLVVVAVMLALGAALLWRAADIWAATHGHGTPGTWTSTRESMGGRTITWYGDFAPDGGGPTRRDVRMEGHVDVDRAHQPLRATYRSGTAYALPGSGQWLALGLVAPVPLAFAVFAAWLFVHDLRRRRRRVF